jgi:hypothetical protein
MLFRRSHCNTLQRDQNNQVRNILISCGFFFQPGVAEYVHPPIQQKRQQLPVNAEPERGRATETVGAAAYCNVIVTSDTALREMLVAVAAWIGSQCRVPSRLAEI